MFAKSQFKKKKRTTPNKKKKKNFEKKCIGMQGYGVSIGGEPGCYIVEKHLSRFVEGQDVHNTNLIWDQMFKSTVNYGRKGLVIQVWLCLHCFILCVCVCVCVYF